MNPDFGPALDALAREDMQRRVRTISLDELRAMSVGHDLTLSQCAAQSVAHGVIPQPILKNFHTISRDGQRRLGQGTVLLAGAGGLGGYALELLTRIGVGRVRLADGDGFEESNMNRQLLATVDSLGRNKAVAGAERAALTCPLVTVEALDCFLDAGNLPTALQGVDIVVDALGGIAPRQVLREAAAEAGVPVIGAAVAGWTALVGSELPGQNGISRMWTNPDDKDAEHVLGSLAPAACFAASCMAAETVQYLVSGTLHLAGRMLHADLAGFNFHIYDLC